MLPASGVWEGVFLIFSNTVILVVDYLDVSIRIALHFQKSVVFEDCGLC